MLRRVEPPTALLLLVLCSCESYREVRLETFDAAMALSSVATHPVVFDVSAVPRDLPLAAPFAQVVGEFPSDYSLSHQSLLVKGECVERGFRPDFVVFQARGLTSDGNTLQVSPTLSSGGLYGFALSSSPGVRTQAAAICYRLAPVSLGLATDAQWMVTQVADSARHSGIMEGDSIQSIDGADVRPRTPQDVAPWLVASLRRKPGDEVAIEWIRPGAGRMHGKLVLEARQRFWGM